MNRKMIHVIASIDVKEGRLPEFLDIFKSNIPTVIEESGCIEYVPTIDAPSGLTTQVCDENVVTIIEKWKTLADLKKHMSSSHMLAYREKVKDHVKHVSLKILIHA
jgi:quinol monooxygenase YgiN